MIEQIKSVLPIKITIPLNIEIVNDALEYAIEWQRKDGGKRFRDRGSSGDYFQQMWNAKIAEFHIADLLGVESDNRVRDLAWVRHSSDITYKGHGLHIKSVAEPYPYPAQDRGWVFELRFCHHVLNANDFIVLTSVWSDLSFLRIDDILSAREVLKNRLFEPFRWNAEKYPTKVAIYEVPEKPVSLPRREKQKSKNSSPVNSPIF